MDVRTLSCSCPGEVLTVLRSVEQTVANLWTYWTNETCPVTTDAYATCTRGYYGEYVIMEKTKEHIKTSVNLARDKNFPLIIRNTGHDFMGRSTGYGALVINTHNFKDVNFVKKYTGPGDWTGGAVTAGAGIQVRELYRLANAQKPPGVVVGGECPVYFPQANLSIRDDSNVCLKMVGLAGGCIQGGGHGPMASFHGMGTSVFNFVAIGFGCKDQKINCSLSRRPGTIV
jgi:FAD/FMN-containing dehydrogenase